MNRFDVNSWKEGAGASYLGMYFVAVVALGALGGFWLDQRFQKMPLFTMLGLFLGMAAGIREMIKVLRQINAAEAEKRKSRAAAAPVGPTAPPQENDQDKQDQSDKADDWTATRDDD